MSIQWFPGHMASARKKAAEMMGKIDVVVEVLDARLPGASSNPLIDRLRRDKQRACLKILNKADLADPEATMAWVRQYGDEKLVKAVALSCKKPGDVAKVARLAATLAPHRDSPLKPLRMLVMGVPNVGKSTLINALLKRKAAKTGDEPAITRHQSRFKLDECTEVIDTPGLMSPSIKHASDGLMLAASHAIGPEAYIDEEVATFLADVLLERYPGLLRTRYDLETAGMDGYGLISAIAKKRGYLFKGGKPHYEKAGLALVHDYRSGLLGRISLETPQSRATMLRPSADGARPADRPHGS
jgi:ribosome biogenesis GTPase A